MGSGECNERSGGAAFTNPTLLSRADSENLGSFRRNVLAQRSREHGCRQSATGCSCLRRFDTMTANGDLPSHCCCFGFMWGRSFIFTLTIQPLPSGAVQILTVKSNTITAGTHCFSLWPTTADMEITDDRRSTDWWCNSNMCLLWGVFDVEIPHRNMMLCNKNGEERRDEETTARERGEEEKRTEYRSVFPALIDSVESLQPSAVVDLGI